MANKVPLKKVTNILTSVGTLNEDFERIEEGFDKTLSRDGSGPNQMEALLDMNNYPIINLPKADRPGMPITYDQIDPGAQEVVVVPVGPDELTNDPELLKEMSNKILVEDGGTIQQAVAVAATPADLLASTAQYTVGSTIRTANGFIYEVAPADATDAHVTTAGGVKLYVERGTSGYDVRAWGVKGDGSDEYDAFQKALNSISTLYQGSGSGIFPGKLRIPSGLMIYVAQGLTIPPCVTIEGDGPISSIVYTDQPIEMFKSAPVGTWRDPLDRYNVANSSGSYWTEISNVGIDGGGVATLGINMLRPWRWHLKRVELRRCVTNLKVGTGTSNLTGGYWTEIEDCVIQGGQVGMHITDFTNLMGVRNCRFDNEIDLQSSNSTPTTFAMEQIYFENTEFSGVSAIEMAGNCWGWKFTNCYFEQNSNADRPAGESVRTVASGVRRNIIFDACAFWGARSVAAVRLGLGGATDTHFKFVNCTINLSGYGGANINWIEFGAGTFYNQVFEGYHSFGAGASAYNIPPSRDKYQLYSHNGNSGLFVSKLEAVTTRSQVDYVAAVRDGGSSLRSIACRKPVAVGAMPTTGEWTTLCTLKGVRGASYFSFANVRLTFSGVAGGTNLCGYLEVDVRFNQSTITPAEVASRFYGPEASAFEYQILGDGNDAHVQIRTHNGTSGATVTQANCQVEVNVSGQFAALIE